MTMVSTKFSIGQKVYWARCEQAPTSVECPDCGGCGRIRVTFHDETTVSIDCQNCARGFEKPTGRVVVYDRSPEARLTTITGIEIKQNGSVEYRTNDSYIIDEDRLFTTRDEALTKAAAIAAEMDRAEREKVSRKEKDTRSWAWNASYHRREIKRAKESIAYHESKLAVASLKAKAKAKEP